MQSIAAQLAAREAEAERNWAEQAAAKAAARSIPMAEKVLTLHLRVKDPAHRTTYAGASLPVSHSLPLMPDTGYTVRSEGGHKIREYKDGTRADTRGRRIMANEKDASNARRAGFVKSED